MSKTAYFPAAACKNAPRIFSPCKPNTPPFCKMRCMPSTPLITALPCCGITKEEARKIFRQKREALPHAARQEMNEQIARQFFSNFLLRDIHVLHSYLPIEKKGEVNTWLIIDKPPTLPRRFRISFPKGVGENLEHYYFKKKNQLKKNRWGILDPQEGEKTPA